MNQNRSCPGVPKRYSTRRRPMVMRPKSIATVVLVLFSTPSRLSKPALALVRASSVRSGRTSLIAPTRVVLPAPKPPATRILKTVSGRAPVPSEGTESMQDLLQQGGAWLLVGGPLGQHRQALGLEQVSQQDPDDSERQRCVGCHVRDSRRVMTQAQDPAMLRGEGDRDLPRSRVLRRLRRVDGDDHCDQV